MRTISCPHCHAKNTISDGQPSTPVECCNPTCRRPIVPARRERLAKSVFKAMVSGSVGSSAALDAFHNAPTPAPAPTTSTASSFVIPGIIGSLTGAAVASVPAVLLSQYWPVFGGFLEKTFADPWSPARQSLIPIHLFVLGIMGAVCGAGLGVAWRMSRKASPNQSADWKPRRWPVWPLVLSAVPCVAAGLLFFGVVSIESVRALLKPEPNAVCRICSAEFTIPESHRGTAAEFTRTYNCPNCGLGQPPMTLYKTRKAPKGQAQRPLL